MGAPRFPRPQSTLRTGMRPVWAAHLTGYSPSVCSAPRGLAPFRAGMREVLWPRTSRAMSCWADTRPDDCHQRSIVLSCSGLRGCVRSGRQTSEPRSAGASGRIGRWRRVRGGGAMAVDPTALPVLADHPLGGSERAHCRSERRSRPCWRCRFRGTEIARPPGCAGSVELSSAPGASINDPRHRTLTAASAFILSSSISFLTFFCRSFRSYISSHLR
jgi:hypothetical protein